MRIIDDTKIGKVVTVFTQGGHIFRGTLSIAIRQGTGTLTGNIALINRPGVPGIAYDEIEISLDTVDAIAVGGN
jgi:hypothetical protein